MGMTDGVAAGDVTLDLARTETTSSQNRFSRSPSRGSDDGVMR